MSGANVTCNIGNQQMGHGAGEMKFEVTTKEPEPLSLANCIAAEVVNDILENALDIATVGDAGAAMAFSVDQDVCPFPKQLDVAVPQLQEAIDFAAIQIPAEQPPKLDAEMKRLLGEMMSPPYEIVNYESIPRKDGVGDQPVDDAKEDEDSEECLVDSDQIKVVEKKTRVTDLVMNSKQVLSEYLMSEETRNRQAEWEERTETVLQVIELDCIKPEEGVAFRLKHLKDKERRDRDESYFAPMAQEESMVNVDLGKADELVAPEEAVVEASKVDVSSLAGSSFAAEGDEASKESFKNKFENLRKKWNINFKLFAFGKKKQKAKGEKTQV